jgi:hypothetical protein
MKIFGSLNVCAHRANQESSSACNSASAVAIMSEPPIPTEPRTRAGDLWQLGEHRIGCGDGRDRSFLQAVVGEGARIDAAFLDPTYNVKINGHANAKGRHREFAMASGEMTTTAFRAFLTETLAACESVSRNGAVHFVCMDWRHLDDLGAVRTEVYNALLNICV